MSLELKQGRFYRAKKPTACSGSGYINDRQIIRLFENTVQYDGPAVRDGRRYPVVTREEFLAWADKDVTDTLPPGEWGLHPRLHPQPR